MTAYIGIPDGQWRWLGAAPKIFRSSPGVERSFCPDCGTPMSFRSDRMSDTMHLYIATLEDPNVLAPTLHVAIEEKLDWLTLNDTLPTCVGPDYSRTEHP